MTIEVTDVPQAEADALMVLYDNGGGASWTNNTGWNTDPVVGNWHGVTVSGGHVTQVLLNNNGGAGNISAFDPSALPSLTQMRLDQNSFSGDLSGWSLPASLTQLRLDQNSFSGDLSGWSLPASLSLMRLHDNSFSGDLSGWTLPALLADLRLYQNSFSGNLSGWSLPASLTQLRLDQNSFSGGPLPPAASALTTYRIEGNGLSTAAVDAVLRGIYAASGSRTGSNGLISVGGSNAPPSGTFRAATSCPVTAATPGKEVAHELANDGCDALTRHWATVTFTAGTVPVVVAASAGRLAVTGRQATVSAPVIIAASVGRLSLRAPAAAVSAPVVVAASVGRLSLRAPAATVSAPVVIAASVGRMSLRGLSATIDAGKIEVGDVRVGHTPLYRVRVGHTPLYRVRVGHTN